MLSRLGGACRSRGECSTPSPEAGSRPAARRPAAGARLACIAAALGVTLGLVDAATVSQPATDAVRAQLTELFPGATRFIEEAGPPPRIRALRAGVTAAEDELLGFVFLTHDLEPLERGYEGPIEMLVGLDTRGTLTGVKMISNREPYGYFSIDLPEFVAQFAGKSIFDRFRVGSDIDAVTTATITVSSATRTVRKSARRVARALLAGER